VAVGLNVAFDLAPVAFIVADATAPGTDGEETVEGFDVFEGAGEVGGGAARLEERHDLPGERLHQADAFGRKAARLGINGAKAAKSVALRIDQRETGIKSNVRALLNKLAAGEAFVPGGVGDDEGFGRENGLGAEGDFAAGLAVSNANPGLEPL